MGKVNGNDVPALGDVEAAIVTSPRSMPVAPVPATRAGDTLANPVRRVDVRPAGRPSTRHCPSGTRHWECGCRAVGPAAGARSLTPPLLAPPACARQAPLGLLAFGMTTFFLMSVDALWSSKVFVGAVAGYAYAYGGFAQMVAGVFEVSAPSAMRAAGLRPHAICSCRPSRAQGLSHACVARTPHGPARGSEQR